MTDKKDPLFYVSINGPDRRVRLSLFPEETGMHLSTELSPDAARNLAKNLLGALDRLPRIVSAADLGIKEAA